MVLNNILNTQALAAVPIPPTGGSANSGLSVVSYRHVFYIFFQYWIL
jgi:hypothetical protein